MKKITPQQKIVNFMLAKQNWIRETTRKKYVYVNKKDIDAILKWTKNTAQKIINEVKDEHNSNNLTFDDSSCPFCYFNQTEDGLNCSTCKYSKHHGSCTNKKNPWLKIITNTEMTAFTPIPINVLNKLN